MTDSSECVVCSSTTATHTRRVVPVHMSGPLADHPHNNVELCDGCAERVEHMPLHLLSLAASVLARRYVPSPELEAFGHSWHRPSGTELTPRDGTDCKMCGVDTNSDDIQRHGGHVLSRSDGKRWNMPRWMFNTPANLVVMCATCNNRLGKESPPLPVALRLLMKPWTWDNTPRKVAS